MEFATLLEKMIVFVALMVVGYICARRGVVNENYTKITSNLVINVFMFATILSSAMDMDTTLGFGELALSFVALTLTIVFCFVVAFVAVRLFRIEQEHAAQFELLAAVSNTMFIGVPVAQGILGPLSVFYISLSNIAFNFMLYSYGIWLLSGGKTGIRIKELLSMPMVASVLALLIFLIKPPVPGAVRNIVSALSGATLPLSMLVIGSSLGGGKLLSAFRNRQLYRMSFVRLILTPLLLGLLARLLISDQVLRMTCIILAACPSGVIISVLSIQYDRDYVFASEGVLQSTALSMLTIPLVLYLFL